MASIIQRNITQLGQKFLKDVNYKDIDYRGFINAAADPTLQSGQVLVNDLKLWIQSSKGDYYRRFDMGGFLDSVQQYSFDDNGSRSLNSALKSAITANFTTIEVIKLEVTPNYPARTWKIQLVVRDKITGALAPVDTSIQAST
jgi:hypothetical protein